MPTHLLVPIAGARWSDGANALELLAPPETATPLQLLQLQGALYNATGKLRWWSTRHPARLVEHCPAVAEALRPLKPHHGNGPQEPTAAARFLATRSFGDDVIDLGRLATAGNPGAEEQKRSNLDQKRVTGLEPATFSLGS